MSNKISILIPCFNSASFIKETLNSILEQTYNNWECIIVDDHSTDNSFELVKEYCVKYPEKFFCFINPRKGACAARNFALEHSKGEYIQYLDADDLLSPDKIERQLQLFQQYGNNIIANCQWGRFYQSVNDVSWEKQPIDKNYDNPIDWLVENWLGRGMCAQHAWLTPRHIIEKAGKWDETLLINQDGEFFCRVLMQVNSIKFSETCGVYYRSGLSGSISQGNKQSRDKALSLLRSYKSYERVLDIQDNLITRKALGHNYLIFIYQFYSLYNDLAKEAEISFYTLGLLKMWPVGGKSFKRLSAFVGFKRAIYIRHIVFILQKHKQTSYFLNNNV